MSILLPLYIFMSGLLSVCQLRSDFLPGDSLFRHENHHVIEEITDFIFNLIGIGIFRGDHDFRGFFSQLLQDFVHTLIEQIIGIRAFLGIFLTIFYYGEHILKYLQGIVLAVRLIIHGNYFIEKTAVGTGMAGGPNLYHPGQNGIHVAVSVKGFHVLIVTAGLSLNPELLAASAVICHFSGMYGSLIGLFVHIGLHKDRICLIVLYDNGQQAVGILFEILPLIG